MMATSMLAARLHGPKDIRVQKVDVPEISDEEILVQVKSSFICGTDVRMYMNGHPAASPDKPLITGHEGAGVIAAVGSGVKHYREGMRVAVAPNVGCGVCDFCISGMGHHCPDLWALGVNIDGFFADYIKVPEEAVRQGNVAIIPEHLSFEEAALAEPLSCVLNAYEKSRIGLGDTVLIIGAGPIGIMHAKLARLGGAAKVFINDVSEARLEQCKTFDPDLITVHGEKLKEAIMSQTNNLGVDVCVTACPAPEAQQTALELMAINGRVSFFGGLPKNREVVGLNSNLIHYRQLEVSGTTRQSLIQYRKTLEMIASGLLDVSDLVTARLPLDRFEEALTAAGSATGLKTVISM
jgi:L-iditol 2-dehydrogenase